MPDSRRRRIKELMARGVSARAAKAAAARWVFNKRGSIKPEHKLLPVERRFAIYAEFQNRMQTAMLQHGLERLANRYPWIGYIAHKVQEAKRKRRPLDVASIGIALKGKERWWRIPLPRPRGARRRIIAELAEEYGCSERQVIRCWDEFRGYNNDIENTPS